MVAEDDDESGDGAGADCPLLLLVGSRGDDGVRACSDMLLLLLLLLLLFYLICRREERERELGEA